MASTPQAIGSDAVSSYQPYWAGRAHLLRRMQRAEEASAAYERAIRLCQDPATHEFLKKQAHVSC
jgi:predicted RNA polymerase sigma factor